MTHPDDHADGMSPIMRTKIALVIAQAIAALDPADVAQRVEWCRTHGELGTSIHFEGDALRFTWGGRDLAIVERQVIVDDALDLPPAEWISTDVPDTVPPEWGSGEVR